MACRRHASSQRRQPARAAHADGFSARLPRGYDTFLGERGVLRDLGVESHQSIEELPLGRVIQRLAEIAIVQRIVGPYLADDQCRDTQQGWL